MSAGSVSLDDFELGRVLGRGAFATVGERGFAGVKSSAVQTAMPCLFARLCDLAVRENKCTRSAQASPLLSLRARTALVVKKDTRKHYALKSLNKQELVALRQVEATKTEREILTTRRPFVVRMHWAFESAHCVHFVLDYLPGGDLYRRMQEAGPMPLDVARLYAAEIALALGHLHAAGLVYHDMKPENVLIDAAGHVALADFGLSRLAEQTTTTFCGTVDYMAPEVVQAQPRDK